MDGEKVAKRLLAIAQSLVEEDDDGDDDDKVASEVDEIIASIGRRAETLRTNPKLPQLNALTSRVIDKIEDRKMLFEFVIMILKRKGEEDAAKRILPILKQFMRGEEEINVE